MKQQTKGRDYVVSFDSIELLQINDAKEFMKTAFDVTSWNHLRKEAQTIWSDKIISAIDGLRKWIIKYDESTKMWICLKMSL